MTTDQLKKKPFISLYWKCQVIGWSLAALYWGYTGYLGGGFNFSLGLLQFVTDVSLYILLTHGYRHFERQHKWKNSTLSEVIKRMIPAILLMGLAYTLVTVVKIWLFRYWFVPGYSQSFLSFVESNWLAIFMAGIRLMSIWILAYQLYQYAQREIKAVRENAQFAIITKEAQLNNLSAQLNPHFLFNSLNNIKALVIENPTSARRAIDLLSDLLRSGLDKNEVMLTTINEELAVVKDYLELEKLRMEERLQQHIEMEDLLGTVPILRLSIQTLVENAIKHGITQQKNGGTIHIKIARNNDFVRIAVQNPGRFDGAGPTTGIGLKNLRERLQLQYKGKATFHITGQPDGTVCSTLLIPIA